MARLVSIAIIYFTDSGFRGIRQALESESKTRVDVGEHANVGDTHACIVDVQVSDSFALHEAQQRLEREMPTALIKTMERFRESWWRRHRWSIAISVGGGIAVAIIVDLARA